MRNLNYMFFGLNDFIPAGLEANTLFDYLFALCIVLSSIIILWLFKYVLIKRAERAVKHTKSKLDDAVVATLNAFNWPFYLVVALYVASFFLELPEYVHRVGSYVILVVAVYYIAKAAQYLISYGFRRSISKHQQADPDYNSASLDFVGRIVKGAIWLVAIILVMQNLGYEITTLVAGLGIGGVAVAFALQSVLTDIFASFSIYFDKPFQVGDYIEIGKDKGHVKRIGIKSTRLETLQGEELIISNQELTESRVSNFKKMDKRRAVFKIYLEYETPEEKLELIPSLMEKIINNVDQASYHKTYFKQFSRSGLEYETLYYIATRKYDVWRDTQHQINLAIKGEFARADIAIANPTDFATFKDSIGK